MRPDWVRPRAKGSSMQYARPFLVAGLAAWMVIMAGGCAGSRQAANEAAPFPPTYERQVYPFEVRDADGTPIDHPFLGGFNLPRPQFVDIDGDGDQDLFVQELTDYLMYFEKRRHRYEPGVPLEQWQIRGPRHRRVVSLL